MAEDLGRCRSGVAGAHIAEVAMKGGPLSVALAAIAGFAFGAFSAHSNRSVANRKSFDAIAESSTQRLPLPKDDARAVALGNALSELAQTENDLSSLARLGAALAKLDSSQIATLLNSVERNASGRSDDRLAWLFTWWMKRDAAAADAWIAPRCAAAAQDGPAGGISFETSTSGRVILAWAKAEPQPALEFARNHPRAGVSTELLRAAMTEWPDRDIRRRVALLLAFPAGAPRTTVLNELHREWAFRDPAAAFASAQTLEPGHARDKVISDILVEWAERDGAAAFGQYRALGLSNSQLLSRILTKTAAKNPAQAATWLAQLDPSQIARCGPKMIETWAEREPAAALNWALANGISLSDSQYIWSSQINHNGFSRSSSGSGEMASPLATALEKQPEATTAWLRSLPSGTERERITELVVGRCRNVDDALSLFSTLPPDAAARTAAGIAMKFQNDPERGREWAMSLPVGPARAAAWTGLAHFSDSGFDLPPGPDRDAFLSGTLHRFVGVPTPAERLATLLQIGDPVLRRDMVDELMELSTDSSQSDEARAALEEAPIPDEWKRRWLGRALSGNGSQ